MLSLNTFRIFIVSIFALLCCFQASALAKGPSWKESFSKGEAAFSDSKVAEAEKHFREALRLVKVQSSTQTNKEACMRRLAATLALSDKTAEARSIYKKLLVMLIREHGRNSQAIEPVLMALGSIEEAAGNHTTAMRYYNRALRINEKSYGTYSPAYAKTLHRIGRVNSKIGKRGLAKEKYQQAISILSKNPNQVAARQLERVKKEYGDLIQGDDQSNRNLIEDFQEEVLQGDGSSSKNSSVPTKSSSSKYKESEHYRKTAPQLKPKISLGEIGESRSKWQQQAKVRLNVSRQGETDKGEKIALRAFVHPASSTTLAPAYRVVNDTVFSQQRYLKSVEQYKRKVAIDVDSLGPNHPSVANDLNGLAQLYVAQEKFEKAEPLLKRALQIYDATYGANNILTINTRIALASVEFHLGNSEQANQLYKQALASGQAAFGPNSLETAKILNGLAFSYYRQGKLEEASTFYRWAISSTESALGSEDPLLAACLQDYAQVLRRLGRESKAAAIETRAQTILSASN